MPTLSKGRVPKYRQYRSSGQAVVTLDGRDFYLGLWRSTASRVEYDRLIGEWLPNGRHLPAPTNLVADLTIIEIADRYLQFATEYYVKDGRPTDTIHGIRRALAYLCELYGSQTAASFGPLALLAIQKKMIAEQKSRRYINDKSDRIRGTFKWAASRELVSVIYEASFGRLGLTSQTVSFIALLSEFYHESRRSFDLAIRSRPAAPWTTTP